MRCFSANTSTPSTTRTGSRFRPACGRRLGTAACVTRGMDGCLVVYTRDGWERFVCVRLEGLDPFSREARQLSRFLFSGAVEAEPDKQGRVMIPPAARRAREARPGGRGGRRARSRGDLGSRRVAHTARRGRRECGACCRTPCSTTRLTISRFSPSEVRELLAVAPGQTVVDATFGAGGHATLLAADLKGKGRLVAIDRDPSAQHYFERFSERAASSRGYCAAPSTPCSPSSRATACDADAILFDLGISSMQVDRPERGFSYAVDAPLDMRMDPSAPVSAKELVGDADERELAELFRRFGEERFSRQIARAIVRRRAERPFERTWRPRRHDPSAVPAPRRFGDGHPARRVFQALRIAVNDELGVARAGAALGVDMLRAGGRLWSSASIRSRTASSSAFSSPRRGAARARPSCRCASADESPTLRLLTKKAVRPSPKRDGRQPALGLGASPSGRQDRRASDGCPRPARPARPQARARPTPDAAPRAARRARSAAPGSAAGRLDRHRWGAPRRHRRAERRRPAAADGARPHRAQIVEIRAENDAPRGGHSRRGGQRTRRSGRRRQARSRPAGEGDVPRAGGPARNQMSARLSTGASACSSRSSRSSSRSRSREPPGCRPYEGPPRAARGQPAAARRSCFRPAAGRSSIAWESSSRSARRRRPCTRIRARSPSRASSPRRSRTTSTSTRRRCSRRSPTGSRRSSTCSARRIPSGQRCSRGESWPASASTPRSVGSTRRDAPRRR